MYDVGRWRVDEHVVAESNAKQWTTLLPPLAMCAQRCAVVGLQDPARQDRAIGLQTLADHDQAELIQAAERGQVRAAEDSVRHVEVFQMGGLGTSILGRPRHLPRDRRASHHPTSDYTLNCEEPPTATTARPATHRPQPGNPP